MLAGLGLVWLCVGAYGQLTQEGKQLGLRRCRFGTAAEPTATRNRDVCG
jgi:hypothetical protein